MKTSNTAVRKVFRRTRFAACLVAATMMLAGCTTSPRAMDGGTMPVLDDGDPFALFREAATAYQESRWIDAARDYQRLTELVPGDADVWFRLGNVYAQQGRYEQAIHAYEGSITRNGGQPKPWFNLATAYLLRAQGAMLEARGRLRENDPALELLDSRLAVLEALIHGRFEDDVTQAGFR